MNSFFFMLMADRYILSERYMLCSNQYYETIENFLECKSASEKLELVFKYEENDPGYPMGCYYFSTNYASSSHGVYFNKNTTNTAQEFSQQICQSSGKENFSILF